MPIKPIDIILRSLGHEHVQSEIRQTGESIEKLGSNAKAGTDKAKAATASMSREFEEAHKRAERLERILAKRPQSLGVQMATQEAREARDELLRVETQARKTSQALQQIKGPGPLSTRITGLNTLIENRPPGKHEALRGAATAAGAGMAVTGVGGLMLGNRLIQESNADRATTAKLEAMLRKRGEAAQIEPMKDWAGQLAWDAALPDDDPIKDATAGLSGFGMEAEKIRALMPGLIGQSRLYNQSLEGVGEAVGRAFAKGDIDSLARIGVTLSDEQKKVMKDLEDAGASQAERQAAMYQILKDSFDQYALRMTEGLSDTEIAANRAKLAMDDLNTNVGTGAARADNFVKGLGVSIANAFLPTQGMQETGGFILELGSYATTAAGGVLTLTAQLGEAKMGLQLLKGARVLDTAATEANTIANVTNAGAVAASGNAAAAATVKMQGAAGGVSLLTRGLQGLQALVVPAIMIPLGIMVVDEVNKRLGGSEYARDKALARLRGDNLTVQGLEAREKYAAESKQLEDNAERAKFADPSKSEAIDKKLLEDKIALEKRYAEALTRINAGDEAAEHIEEVQCA